MTEKIESMDELLDGSPDASIGIRGLFRVKINNDRAEMVGDSGWCRNVVVAEGVEWILKRITSDTSDSTLISDYGAAELWLGTGGAVSYADTDIPGYADDGVMVFVWHNNASSNSASHVRISSGVTTSAASSGWSTLQFLATFNSGWNTASKTINNVGVYDTDGPGGGTFFAGNSYSGTVCATNQAVQVTYNILMGNQ